MFLFIVYKSTNLHLQITLRTPACRTDVRVVEEEFAAVGTIVLDLVGDALAVVRADEVLDAVRDVGDGLRLLNVLDWVAAIVAARGVLVCARSTEHLARQVPVVANVDHNIALAAASLEIFRHVRAVDATHQVLDAAFPLVATDRECLEVHVVDNVVAEVAAVVAVVVLHGHEVHTADHLLNLGNAFLDLDARHVGLLMLFARRRGNDFDSFQKKHFNFFETMPFVHCRPKTSPLNY